jgi:hypothetical protein
MMRALWRDLLVHVGLFGVLVVGAPAWASALWDPVTEVEGMQPVHHSTRNVSHL